MNQKLVSFMGYGKPILKDKGLLRLPADRRLDKEEARRLNGKEQKENIAFQNRLLELEGQREILLNQ